MQDESSNQVAFPVWQAFFFPAGKMKYKILWDRPFPNPYRVVFCFFFLRKPSLMAAGPDIDEVQDASGLIVFVKSGVSAFQAFCEATADVVKFLVEGLDVKPKDPTFYLVHPQVPAGGLTLADGRKLIGGQFMSPRDLTCSTRIAAHKIATSCGLGKLTASLGPMAATLGRFLVVFEFFEDWNNREYLLPELRALAIAGTKKIAEISVLNLLKKLVGKGTLRLAISIFINFPWMSTLSCVAGLAIAGYACNSLISACSKHWPRAPPITVQSFDKSPEIFSMPDVQKIVFPKFWGNIVEPDPSLSPSFFIRLFRQIGELFKSNPDLIKGLFQGGFFPIMSSQILNSLFKQFTIPLTIARFPIKVQVSIDPSLITFFFSLWVKRPSWRKTLCGENKIPIMLPIPCDSCDRVSWPVILLNSEVWGSLRVFSWALVVICPNTGCKRDPFVSGTRQKWACGWRKAKDGCDDAILEAELLFFDYWKSFWTDAHPESVQLLQQEQANQLQLLSIHAGLDPTKLENLTQFFQKIWGMINQVRNPSVGFLGAPAKFTPLPNRIYHNQQVVLLGESGSVFLTGSGSATHERKHAEVFTIEFEIPSRNPLQPRIPFFLRSTSGRYLQRTTAVIRPEDPTVHKTIRFEVGLSGHHTQTWQCEAATPDISFRQIIGLTVAGKNPDRTSPDNQDRRYLTLRPGDPNVVVSWFRENEHVSFVPP